MAEEITLQDILIHLTRLEAKMDEIGRNLDKQQIEIERHWKKLAEHDRAIAKLEERQSPKVHPTVWVLSVIAILGFTATFITYVTQ
jgi:hypothetical protein